MVVKYRLLHLMKEVNLATGNFMAMPIVHISCSSLLMCMACLVWPEHVSSDIHGTIY